MSIQGHLASKNRFLWGFAAGYFIFKLFIFMNCNLYLSFDSYEYIQLNGWDIFSLHLDAYRVPLYPLLIDFFVLIFKNNALVYVTVLQFVISFCSTIYLFKTLALISNKTYINLLSTGLYSCSFAILGWDKAILTESLALSLSIFLIYNLVAYLKTKKLIYPLYLAIIGTLGTFLRPTFILYLGIVLGFFLLRAIFLRKERKEALISSSFFILPILLISIYCFLFLQQHQLFTFSHSLMGQQITILSQTGLYQYSTDKDIVETIDKVALSETFANQPALARQAIIDQFDPPRINSFIKEIRTKHTRAYIREISHIFWRESAVSFSSYYEAKNPFIGKWLYRYSTVLRYDLSFMQGLMVTLICSFIFGYRLLKHKYFDWLYLGLFVFIFFTYLTSIFGTNGEFQRTAITVLPFVALALHLFLTQTIDFLHKSTNPNLVGVNHEIQ